MGLSLCPLPCGSNPDPGNRSNTPVSARGSLPHLQFCAVGPHSLETIVPMNFGSIAWIGNIYKLRGQVSKPQLSPHHRFQVLLLALRQLKKISWFLRGQTYLCSSFLPCATGQDKNQEQGWFRCSFFYPLDLTFSFQSQCREDGIKGTGTIITQAA